MLSSIGKAFLIATAMAVAASAASAGGYGEYRETRAEVRDAPVKDCTRINGRVGYYGNPWCTRAEQARWDRWSARRRWTR